MSAQDCIAIVRKAAPNISDDDLTRIFEKIQSHRERLTAEGKISQIDRRLRQLAREEGTKAKVAAAIARKHAALNIIVRDRLETIIGDHVAGGLSYPRAVLAVLEGTSKGIKSGRHSVAATRLAFESEYVGDMLAGIVAERPHIEGMLRDTDFADDVVREMMETRQGGKPGKSGNKDAEWLASHFSTFSELSRTGLNRLGAAIGKLDGWAGPQVHDPHRLLTVTEDEWIDTVMGALDLDRTFGRDQGRIDSIVAEHGRATAEHDRLAQSARLLTQGLDAVDARSARLADRKAALGRRREIAAARLDERQGEMGANFERLSGNLDAGVEGKIERDLAGRHQAGERLEMRRKSAARENATSLNRLRNKSGQAHGMLARIDSDAARVDAELAGLPTSRADIEARRAETAERLAAARSRLKQLDLARADLRPEVDDPREFLRQAYRNIVTGRDNTITAAQKGEITGPANLAKSLEKHRVLHFASADAWISYNRKFGHGNIITSMISHQQRAARLAAQMDVLGPNPETMMAGLLDSLQLRIRNDARIPDHQKANQIRALTTEGHGRIASALAEVRGLTLAPENLNAAMIGTTIRAQQSLSKLMAAVVSSISDVVTAGANINFHGKPLGAAYADQVAEILKGRGAGERKEIAYLIGEGFDGMIGHVLSAHAAGDGAPGLAAKMMEFGFRWSGLTGWTDRGRAAAARNFSAYVGLHVGKRFAALDARFRHGLSLHGIDEPRWNALRQAQFRAQNGNVYVTGDRIRSLPDAAIDLLIPDDDIAEARAHFRVDETDMQQFKRTVPVPNDVRATRQAKFDGWLNRRRDRERYGLELSVRRYFADEVNYSVIEADDQTRRMMYWGMRPGSFWGEAARFVMQFKGYPIAFTNRVIGRALFGGRGETAGQRLLNNSGHIGHLIIGLTVAGYASMTAKDALRGWWPPRDPTDPKTLLAAFAQGGGGGIYGDFLFGQASRFGNKPLETVAGPALGTAASLVDLYMQAREGSARAGDTLGLALQNTPYLNMWWARPGLDWLLLNSAYEGLNPGYLARQERKRRRDMGQSRIWPAA